MLCVSAFYATSIKHTVYFRPKKMSKSEEGPSLGAIFRSKWELLSKAHKVILAARIPIDRKIAPREKPSSDLLKKYKNTHFFTSNSFPKYIFVLKGSVYNIQLMLKYHTVGKY